MAQVTISSPPLQEPGGSQRWLEWFNTIDGILSQLAGVQDGGFVNAANITYSGDNIFSGDNTFTGIVDLSGATVTFPSPITNDLEFSGEIEFSDRIVYFDENLVLEHRGNNTKELIVWENVNSTATVPIAPPIGPSVFFVLTSGTSGQKNVITVSGPDGGELMFAANNSGATTTTNGASVQYDDSAGGDLLIQTLLAGGDNTITIDSGGTLDVVETNETDGNVYIGGNRGATNDAPSASLVLPAITRGLRLNNVNNTNEGNFAGDGREGMLWYNTTIDKLKFYNGTPAAEIVFSEEAANLQTYTPSNVTTLRTFNADDPPSRADLADCLGTLIADLQSIGIIL